MAEIKLHVHRNMTADPNDEAGIRRFHEDRRRLIEGLIASLDLETKGEIKDVDENGRPREVGVVEII
jgi:hypothetical protein